MALPIKNVRVFKDSPTKNKEAANDNYPEKAPGSPSTIDEDFSKQQYGNPYANNLEKEPDKESVNQKNSSLQTQESQNLKQSKIQNISSIQKVAEKNSLPRIDVWAISATILSWCAPVFLIQISFWLLSIVGFLIEFGSYSIGDFFGDNLVGEFISDLASSVVPGESIFLLGYLVCLYNLHPLKSFL